MSNMSYCRFQNTASDFADCLNAFLEGGLDDLSADEKKAAKQLYDMAREYVECYAAEVDDDA